MFLSESNDTNNREKYVLNTCTPKHCSVHIIKINACISYVHFMVAKSMHDNYAACDDSTGSQLDSCIGDSKGGLY